jgi:DNA-binding NarL/FixJ family response regulator
MVVSTKDKEVCTPKLSLCMPPLDILLIEDVPHDAYLIRRSLNQISKVFWEETIDAGIKSAREGHYDLVLLSLDLGGDVSLKSFQKFMKAHPEAPVIVLSDSETKLLAEAAINQGAMSILDKSLIENSEYLVKMITSFMLKVKFLKKAEELLAKKEKEKTHRVSTWSLANILDHKPAHMPE